MIDTTPEDRKKAVAEVARLQQAFREFYYRRPWNQTTLDTSPYYVECEAAYMQGYADRKREFTASDADSDRRARRIERAFTLACNAVASGKVLNMSHGDIVRFAYSVVDELDAYR